MAATPTFLAATQSGTTDTLSSSKTVPIPAGTSAGSVVVILATTGTPAGTTITWPSGFTEFTGGPWVVTTDASGQTYQAAWKRSTSGEGSGNYSLSFSSTIWNIVQAYAMDGCRGTGDPFEDLDVGVNTGTSVTTLTSTTTDNDLLVFHGIGDSNNGPMDWTPPTGPGTFTEVIDNDYNHISWLADTASGSRSVSGATMSTNQIHGQMVIAFIGGDPPPPPTTVQQIGVTLDNPTSASAFTPTLPTNAAGDRMTLVVTGKYNTTSVPTINQGWTLVGSGTGGTGSTGNDAGQTFWAVYQKDSGGSETAPTVTPGGTAPNSWEWICTSHRPGSGFTWADTIATSGNWVKAASDTSTSSPLTGTAAAFGTNPTAGDAIFCVGVIPTDLGTALGTTTLTCTGLSGGTKSTASSQYIEASLGQDSAAVWAGWTDFTGTASAGVAMSFTVTGASNQSGSLVAVALRQVSTGYTGTATLSGTATITATGSVGTPGNLTGTATRAATATITATGVVARSSTASIAATASIHASAGNPGLVAAVSGNDRYLVDDLGNPVIPLFDTIWPMVQQAGNTARNGGSATWDEDIDFWVSTRASQGFTALKFTMFGQAINGAPSNDSHTWDNIFPFGSSGSGTANANPSSGKIEAYWQRVDYILDACAAAGLTAFIHILYADDVDSGLMSGKATSEFQNLGTFLGTRYADKPGIVWVIGGDYFDTSITQIEALRTNMIAAGDTHLFTVQNWANQASNEWTTSRKDDGGATQQLGTDIADLNACYIYDPTYESAAAAWVETPTIPAIWYDGYYDQGTGDQLQQRRYVGWSLSYGQWGCQFGSEDLWDQPNGWRTDVSSPDATVSQIVTMRNSIAAIDGWGDLVPDLSSTFITAGRSSGNNFVTGSINGDGTLALIYIPVASSAITVDTTQMAAGYTVTWIDPINGATSAGTPGTSFSKGSNSGGSTDWFLLLQATGDAEGTASLAATSTRTATGAVGKVATAALAATVAITAAGVVGKSTTASLSGTDTVTATGSLGKVTTATLSETAQITATGVVGKSGTTTLSGTAAVTATGVSSAGVEADLSAAATITAAGVVAGFAGATLAGIDALTTTGVVGKVTTLTLAATDAITATGAVGKNTSATLAGTAAVTATGVVARTGTSTLNATADIIADGVVTVLGTGEAELDATATVTATGSVASTGTAALGGAATITATGTVGAAGTGQASLAATDQITATGTMAAAGAAGLAASDQITTAGQVGRSTNASLAATATVTATGVVGASSAAVLSASGTVTATGATLAAGSGTATLTGTGQITAAGMVAKTGEAHLDAVATLTALGDGGTAVMPTDPRAVLVDNPHRATLVDNGHAATLVGNPYGGKATVDSIVAGDTAPAFTCVLTDAGLPYDATGAASVTVKIWQDGQMLVDRVASTVAADGTVTCDWQAGETDEPGPIKARVVVFSGGKQATFPPRGFMTAHISPASP
jgi:hypothetical protein